MLPLNEVEVTPHRVWLGPAFAGVGFFGKAITTSSVEGVQVELVMVQRKVYVVPAVPIKVEVEEAAFEKEPPVPEITVQAPVPTVGAFALSAVEVNPHKLNWSAPALAVLGFKGK